jgi:hypothetical protein
MVDACGYDNEPSGSIKSGEFLGSLSCCQLLTMISASELLHFQHETDGPYDSQYYSGE